MQTSVDPLAARERRRSDDVANDGRAGEGDNVAAVERTVAHASGSATPTEAAEEIQVWA